MTSLSPIPAAADGELELVDQDIVEAMRRLPGYVDISTDDFRALYHLAYHHAAARLAGGLPPAPATTSAMEPPRVGAVEIARAWAGAFTAIAALMWANAACFTGSDLTLLNGSFGASSALLFGASRSPFSQPRNLIAGYLLSATIGVTCFRLCGSTPILAGALAVATSIAVMHATRTLHPPAAGIALAAVIGSTSVHQAGFLFVLAPATAGPLLLLAVAVAHHKLVGGARYPDVWF